jgi:hypothetical protein
MSATSAPGSLTPKTLGWSIGGLLILCAVLAVIVGTVGAAGPTTWNPSDHFDWSLAAVAGTALGTVLLAGFTGALAYTTSGDVRATWVSVELTREELAIRDRPTVVVISAGVATRGPQGTAWRATLRNVGIAPALQVDGSITARVGRRDRSDFSEDFYFSIIEVGEEREVRVTTPTPGEELADAALYTVKIEGIVKDRTLVSSWPIVDVQHRPPGF